MDTRKSPMVKPTAFAVGLSEKTHGVDLNPPKLYLNSCRSNLYLFRYLIWFPINAQHALLESEEYKAQTSRTDSRVNPTQSHDRHRKTCPGRHSQGESVGGQKRGMTTWAGASYSVWEVDHE
jgi:hypothetical protein